MQSWEILGHKLNFTYLGVVITIDKRHEEIDIWIDKPNTITSRNLREIHLFRGQ